MKTEPGNTRECQWPPETGREKEWILLRAIVISDLRPLKLWWDEYYCLKPLVCGNLLWQPQKASAGPSAGEREGWRGVSTSLWTSQNSSTVGGDGGGKKGGKNPPSHFVRLPTHIPPLLHYNRAQFGDGIVHPHMSSSQTGHTLWMRVIGMGVWQSGLAQARTAALLLN